MGHYLEDELNQRLRTDDGIRTSFQASCLDGMWYRDLENPEHEWISPQFWELLGYDPDAMPHSPHAWQKIIHPADKASAIENFEKHLADPGYPYDQMVRYRHAHGHMIWVRCRGFALRDANDKPIRMLGAHTDLTALVRDAEDRHKSARVLNARLSAVLNATQSGIIGLNSNREVVTLNPPARHLLGGISDQTPFLWPHNIRFLDNAELKPMDASADPINRALAGATLRGEVHLITRDRSDLESRYVRVSSARVDEADTDVHTVVVLDDVSEQERNRQQVERQGRLDALGQLSGGIAHDFNNLMSTILYAAVLVKQQTDDSRAQVLLDEMVRTIDRGRTLTDRLMAFAQDKADAPASHAIGSVFAGFHTLARPAIEEQIDIRYEIDDRAPSIFCDAPLLENALLNLVLNSRDAILRSGVGDVITLRAAPLDSRNTLATLRDQDTQYADGNPLPFVVISVSDNGPGMDAETRRRATDPFFSTKTEHSGTGLGLSIVFGFVQQSGGKLQIRSEPNVETTISLILPIGDSNTAPDKTAGRHASGRGQGETVLLVEDEESLLAIMSEQIRSMGYDVLAVNSGMAALMMIEDGLAFDVLISDIVMPGGVGGFELVRKLRTLRPEVPALLLSGYTGYSREEREGIEAVILQKPCMPYDLDAALREMLDAPRADTPARS